MAGIQEDELSIESESALSGEEEEEAAPMSGDDAAGPELTEDKLEQNGYTCEFVTPPPSALQVQCPICLLVLREPQLITCCGHKFCKGCVTRIEASKPCPLCKQFGFQVVPEKSLHCALNDLKVYCIRKNDGCEWVGELRSLDNHLNVQPVDRDKRFEGCAFVVLKCICRQRFLRKNLKEHEENNCRKSCGFCNHYTGTFDEVGAHYMKCAKFPLHCPNGCGIPVMERQYMEKHIAEECPLAVISCEAGCDVQVKREEMPAHMSENPVKHISYLASKVKEQENTIVALRRQLTDTVVPPLIFKIEEQRLNLEDVWTSKPFSTHPGGYKFCLKVWPLGYGETRGTDATFSVHFVRSELDQHLPWPRSAIVTIEILNGAISFTTGNPHCTMTFACRQRQATDDHGAGTPKSIPLPALRGYISRNILLIRVSKVEVLISV